MQYLLVRFNISVKVFPSGCTDFGPKLFKNWTKFGKIWIFFVSSKKEMKILKKKNSGEVVFFFLEVGISEILFWNFKRYLQIFKDGKITSEINLADAGLTTCMLKRHVSVQFTVFKLLVAGSAPVELAGLCVADLSENAMPTVDRDTYSCPLSTWRVR